MQWILRFRVYAIISLAVVLISAAVIFSVLRAVLPYATGYKNEIQQEISKQIGLPVEISSIDAAIHWFSPRLRLLDVSVYDEKNKVPLINLREAFVELDVVASILRGEIIVDDVGLVGADISIEKLSEDEWMVQGVKFTSEGSTELPEQFMYMLQNANYLLHDSNIYYQDNTQDDFNLSLLDVNMDVENSFNNHEIKFSMNLPEQMGKSLAVVASLKGDIDSLDGEIYIEAINVNVKQWDKKFNFAKEYQLAAALDVNLWGSIHDNDIQSLFVQLVANDLTVKNNVTAKAWDTNYLSANIRYVNDDRHWNIAVTDFYFGEQDKPVWGQPVTMLASDDGYYYYLSADYLHYSDALEVADVVLMPEQLSGLEAVKAYNLQAELYNFSLQLPKDMTSEKIYDELYLEATINDFSVHDKDNNIFLSGVDLSVRYDNNKAIIDLATKDAELELNDLFRQSIFAETIQGEIKLEHFEDAWLLSTEKLKLKNDHINTLSRVELKLSADNKTFVDVQTDFYDAYGKYAAHYLPVGVMSPELVEWLDMAVIDGYVPDGHFILRGQLDGFPYDKHDGIFQVLFSSQNLNLKFLQDWPILAGLSSTIKFSNSSLVVSDAKGITQGAKLFNGRAEIMDLTAPHLTVAIDAHANNEDVQSYVWNSGLDDVLGNALRLFQIEGESDLNLKLEVPLNEDVVNVATNGRLNFIDTDIYYPALGYEINAINGVVDFTKETIFADSITARMNDEPVSINAFTGTGDSGQQVVFQLDGVIDVDYLLQQYEWIPTDWLAGNSEWSINFEVPYEPKDYLVHVAANSYLEDVVIDVSDKVLKPDSKKLGFAAKIDILDNNDLRVIAKFSESDKAEKDSLVDLFAVRNENKIWNFNLKSAYATGKGEFTEGLDKDTRLKLDLDEVNVHALFVSENKNNSKSLNPSEFPPLDLKAQKVLWDDWVFTEVTIETDWHEHGMLINTLSLTGASMTFDARGTWLTSWRGLHETVLQGTIQSSNLGETLVGLNFPRSLDRCDYTGSFDSKWPAEPYRLSWENMQGKVSFEMHDGEMLDVDPGTSGRLLGLLNIFKLTSRLVLDFDDVTRKGFAFDSINGNFEFANGEGSLKNFEVIAPAADIDLFGGVGLVERDYDLLMTVKPHTDTLTFAGGAILGGVVIGAGLALIQKVLDLSVIGHDIYSITGSWDDPKVEKITEKNDQAENAEEDDF